MFLTRQELYRLLQRELPEGVYPDGAPDKFYSTADMDAIADVAATGYANLSTIYDNYFPQTATEKLGDWEEFVLARRLDSSLTIQKRRERILAKLRSRRGITKQDMVDVVKGIIGLDKIVDISEWGCSTGGWLIGESQLGIETIFSGQNLVDATGADLCQRDPSEFGKTPQEWLEMRTEAYTYQVNIYGYTLSNLELTELNLALDSAEPARSGRVIVDGLDPNDILEGDL